MNNIINENINIYFSLVFMLVTVALNYMNLPFVSRLRSKLYSHDFTQSQSMSSSVESRNQVDTGTATNSTLSSYLGVVEWIDVKMTIRETGIVFRGKNKGKYKSFLWSDIKGMGPTVQELLFSLAIAQGSIDWNVLKEDYKTKKNHSKSDHMSEFDYDYDVDPDADNDTDSDYEWKKNNNAEAEVHHNRNYAYKKGQDKKRKIVNRANVAFKNIFTDLQGNPIVNEKNITKAIFNMSIDLSKID